MVVLLFLLLRREKPGKRIAVSLLVPYLFLLLYSTVFRRSASGSFRYNIGLFGALQRVLLNTGKKRADAVLLIVFNILMLVPLGLLLPACIKQRRWVIPLGFLFSLMIELLQFFLRRGFFELDDLICNTLGVAIGLGLYTGFDQLFCRCTHKICRNTPK